MTKQVKELTMLFAIAISILSWTSGWAEALDNVSALQTLTQILTDLSDTQQ